MLELKNIYKIYNLDKTKKIVLENISLRFRKKEFVAVTGASGSGKTTLLNIIGGLDRFDKGDLIIDGASTEKFSCHDWDRYRNYCVGFIFQNDYLIEHQSVLENIELVLTLSGISGREKRKRATEVLEEVGLKDDLYKKPAQLSDGQKKRVSIARALVCQPRIILADEPTGTLDTENSYQIMEILKKVAQERLVIVVTHDQELAMEYATRIIRIIDGSVLEDSMPYTGSRKNFSMIMEEKPVAIIKYRRHHLKRIRTWAMICAVSIGVAGVAVFLAFLGGIQTHLEDCEKIIFISDTGNRDLILGNTDGTLNLIRYIIILLFAVTLTVSILLIGMISYISMEERKREIGILRSLGVTRWNILYIFISETCVIGIVSGILGIAFNYLTLIILNRLVEKNTGLTCLAALSWKQAVFLVGSSIILALLAGGIPILIAVKQDPAEVLRSR